MKLETKEEYLVDSAIEMLYPTVTFKRSVCWFFLDSPSGS